MTPASELRTGSLRLRTILSVGALLVVLLLALAVAVDLTLGARLRGQIEDRLRDRAAAAAALSGTVDSDELADRLSAQGLSVRIEDADGGATVAGPSPEQLRKGPAAGDPLPGPADRPTPLSTADTEATSTVTVESSTVEGDDQLITLISRLSDGSTITLTAPAGSVQSTLVQFRWVMAAASLVFLVIAGAGLVLMVRMSLRPLDRVTAVARSIANGDRGRRLRPSRNDTEIGRTAAAFDEMLDAVEGAERRALDAEARVRSFVSDAAHELRTPVAGMRAAAETIVRGDLGRDDRERMASHVVREAERASRLIDDMLMMARVDRGLELELQDTDLPSLVVRDAERYALRWPALDIRISAPSVISGVPADPERVRQVLGNLVHNAASAGASTVSIAMKAAAGSVRVTVRDDGRGVPDADRERIFDRLVRLDAGRGRTGGGAGLGLPIARGIARAHGGDLVCDRSAAGASFTLTLPASTRSDRMTGSTSSGRVGTVGQRV